MIRPATIADAKHICSIYNHYVSNTVITFEERPVAPKNMARRIESVTSKSLPWLVNEESGAITGYAYAAPWRVRSAYRFTLESTVYIDPACLGRGLGIGLCTRLLELLLDTRVHAVLAVIALPNQGSIALNEKLGFTKVAHLSEVGFKFGRWIDVGIWEARL